jgi:putative SOS response-associated peptidase YedK
MCGRFTLRHSTDEIVERFGAQEVLLDLPPRYNIAPTQPVAAVTAPDGARRLEGLQWGLVPFWAKDPAIGSRMINARAETIAEKPAYKNAFLRRRCLIPADGFYEWQKTGGRSQPMYIRLRGDDLFAFAGLWEEWQSPDGSPLRTCTIITVPPNDLVAPIHDRMPAILRRDDEGAWLNPDLRDPGTLRGLLMPHPDAAMDTYPVSRLVNAPTVDDPECVAPLAGNRP